MIIIPLVVFALASFGFGVLFWARWVRGEDGHRASVLARWGVPHRILRPGEGRLRRPGEEVVLVSTDWHDLQFRALTRFRGGPMELSGTLSFRVSDPLAFLGVVPVREMPGYPGELLRDFLHTRLEEALRRIAGRFLRPSPRFWKRVEEEMVGLLEGSVEVKILGPSGRALASEREPEEEEEEEILGLLTEARDVLKCIKNKERG